MFCPFLLWFTGASQTDGANLTDKNVDWLMDNIIAACSLSAFAGVCFAAFYSMIAAKAPASWLSICLIILAAFTILSAWAAIKAFRVVN